MLLPHDVAGSQIVHVIADASSFLRQCGGQHSRDSRNTRAPDTNKV